MVDLPPVPTYNSQMAKKKQKRKIGAYSHGEERANNPPVGLVTPRTDPDKGERQTYAHDPHLNPQLQWAGKAEHTSFEVPTVSLHVHERIDSRTIVEAVRKRNGGGNGNGNGRQASLFEAERTVPLRQAIEFYRHARNWSNRLIAGDSLLVMNSLLQKENMAGKVQCVYMDPPYGIKYGSNFQPFINKRDVEDGKDEDLTAEPEMIKAFRDTWELGIHSYLSYLRDRLLLIRELLTESGSVFVQISDENVHHVREIMDEIFGMKNFVSLITFRKKNMPLGSKTLENMCDYILWYSKNKASIKYRQLWKKTEIDLSIWKFIETSDGKRRRLTADEKNGKTLLAPNSKLYQTVSQVAPSFSEKNVYGFEFQGETYRQRPGQCWVTTKEKMNILAEKDRLQVDGNSLRYILYQEDFPYSKITNPWMRFGGAINKNYVVQTNHQVIARCILMTTDPGDLVFDPTCGSGTTAHVAEQWGRRWITCDTSRVATTLAKQRLMTGTFDYYQLAHPDEGVGSDFVYKTAPHITLKSIANDEPPATETLYDQPLKDTKRVRVTGPFTVEAVPSPTVQPIDDIAPAEPAAADESVTRSGETLRQREWRDELLQTGIRGKSGQHISFSRVDPLPCRYLHADAETRPDSSGENRIGDASQTAYRPCRAVISFGPEYMPLEQRQVENALQEASKLMPKPEMVIFAAFQFDPESAKDIDETNWPGVQILKVQMNADMQIEDLKKNRANNESFWLIGQPDISVEAIEEGDDSGKWQVQVHGFDYFNTKNGEMESGDAKRIAVWMLDTDYDGRCMYPRQVFFPMAGDRGGWTRLARNLRAEIDEELIECYKGSVSLPFELGENRRVAVKIVDDRGIESLKVIECG